MDVKILYYLFVVVSILLTNIYFVGRNTFTYKHSHKYNADVCVSIGQALKILISMLVKHR